MIAMSKLPSPLIAFGCSDQHSITSSSLNLNQLTSHSQLCTLVSFTLVLNETVTLKYPLEQGIIRRSSM